MVDPRLIHSVDALICLEAPGFDRVLDWRTEQETSRTGAPVPGARRDQLSRFVQYFEPISPHMLAGGVAADVVPELGDRCDIGRIQSSVGP